MPKLKGLSQRTLEASPHISAIPFLNSSLCSPHSSHTDLPVSQAGSSRHAPAQGICPVVPSVWNALFPRGPQGSLPSGPASLFSCSVRISPSLPFKMESATPCTFQHCCPHSIYYHVTGSTFYFACSPAPPKLECKIHKDGFLCPGCSPGTINIC